MRPAGHLGICAVTGCRQEGLMVVRDLVDGLTSARSVADWNCQQQRAVASTLTSITSSSRSAPSLVRDRTIKLRSFRTHRQTLQMDRPK